MTHNPPKRPLKFRSVFISDVHLGFRGCRAESLLDFLKSLDTEYLYLVGDIVDLWSMKRTLYWPQSHNNVVRLILSKAKHGTRVIYVPGNHDMPLREHVGMTFGNVQIEKTAEHVTADGRRFLVMHGDEFDNLIKCGSWLNHLGHHAYDLILALNRYYNAIRQRFGYPYWSLAAYLKHKAKSAVDYIDRFENTLAHEGHRLQFDGIVCGHIHRARAAKIKGIEYFNCGDWVESCTALVEDQTGCISLLHLGDQHQATAPAVATLPIPEIVESH